MRKEMTKTQKNKKLKIRIKGKWTCNEKQTKKLTKKYVKKRNRKYFPWLLKQDPECRERLEQFFHQLSFLVEELEECVTPAQNGLYDPFFLFYGLTYGFLRREREECVIL